MGPALGLSSLSLKFSNPRILCLRGASQRVDFRGRSGGNSNQRQGRFPNSFTYVAVLSADRAFLPRQNSSNVTLLCEDLPPGLRPADNEAGSRQSLEQLARCFDDGDWAAQGRESQSAGSAKGGRK
jgi:hypothetical protein